MRTIIKQGIKQVLSDLFVRCEDSVISICSQKKRMSF
jgi:hypothetical protein